MKSVSKCATAQGLNQTHELWTPLESHYPSQPLHTTMQCLTQAQSSL